MKKLIGISVFLFALTVVSADVFAWNSRRGAEWIKNPARYATVNSVDAAQYNPAGLVKMQAGIYTYLGNQFAFKTIEYNNRDTDVKTTDNTPTWLYPNLTAAYVADKAAVFIGYDVVSGGGSVDFKEDDNTVVAVGWSGSALTGFHRMKGSSSTTASTLGVSYEINDMIAVTAGMRYVMYTATSSTYLTTAFLGGRAQANYINANGFTGFVGINVTPIEKLNIAVNFQPTTRLVGNQRQVDNADNSGITRYDRYENGFLTVGIGYEPIENLEVQFGFYYGFFGERNYGDESGAKSNENGNMRAKLEFALGAEYSLGLVRPSMGINIQRNNGTSRSNSYGTEAGDPQLNNVLIGLGCAIVPNEMIRVDIGVAKSFYAEGNSRGLAMTAGVSQNISINRDVWLIGLGIASKF